MSDVPLQAHAEHPPHHPFLQHQFEDMGQQHEASTLGMWMFLATEILFFGGFLCAYAVYRLMYYGAFQAGADQQNWRVGAANTAVLIGSSLTMALAVWAAQLGRRKLIILFLFLTLFLGGVFIAVKGYEYTRHFHEGLFPGKHFTFVDEHHPELTPGIEMFMVFYFGLTGLHAMHMIVGAGLLVWMITRAWRGEFGPEYYAPVEVMGLYWHFVDIVWIFLFPLLYLLHGPH